MQVTSYLLQENFSSFALSSSLLIYLFHEYHWFGIISEFQTKKKNNNETFIHAKYRGYYTF